MNQEQSKVTSYFFLANTYRRLNLLKKAIKCYDSCIKIDKNCIGAYIKAGYLYYLLEDTNRAASYLNKAISIDNKNYIAHHYLGLVFKDTNFFDQARLHFKQAFALNPSSGLSAYHLGELSRIQNKTSDAIKWYQKASEIPSSYQSDARYMIQSLQKTSSVLRAPKEYIEKLFDGYSQSFEANLCKNLEYKVPEQFRDILLRPPFKKIYARGLDLGCGTGLCGEEVIKLCERLEGVDLSLKMLKKAKQKHIYNELHHEDIITYLKDTHQKYDLVVCGDTLIYFGDLSKVFKLIRACLKDSGNFLFSIEAQSDGSFELQKTARFSHSSKYIRKLAEKFRFNIKLEKNAIIRTESKDPINGKIFLLQAFTS